MQLHSSIQDKSLKPSDNACSPYTIVASIKELSRCKNSRSKEDSDARKSILFFEKHTHVI